MRIASVHLLIDVETDAAASDFCSETFGNMPYVVDWAHAAVNDGAVTREYDAPGSYNEGDFLRVADEARR